MSEQSSPPVGRPSGDGNGVPGGARSDAWAHEVTHAEAEATRRQYEARNAVSMYPPPSSDVTYGKLTAQEFRLGLRYLIP